MLAFDYWTVSKQLNLYYWFISEWVLNAAFILICMKFNSFHLIYRVPTDHYCKWYWFSIISHCNTWSWKIPMQLYSSESKHNKSTKLACSFLHGVQPDWKSVSEHHQEWKPASARYDLPVTHYVLWFIKCYVLVESACINKP